MKKHFVKFQNGIYDFMSSLWCSPRNIVLHPSVRVIEHSLGNSTNYISIHQRNFEGLCILNFCNHFNISNLSPHEVPLHLESWKEPIRWEKSQRYPKSCTLEYPKYPLCELNSSYILEVFKLQNISISDIPIHLGTDGQTDGKSLIKDFHVVIPKHRHPSKLHEFGYAMIDLFLFIHSDFFIQSPLSTFSGMACIVRQILNLHTVPIMNYTYDNISIPERITPGWFVGCDSVRETIRYFGRNNVFPKRDEH